jgi:hypothetical protein
MEIFDIKNMFRGWFLGDFEPSVYETKDFEVGYLSHSRGEIWPSHYHEKVLEINLLIKGKIKFNNIMIEPGQIFIFKPFEVSEPEFLEDCELVCIKTPSIPSDKIIV